MAKCIIYHRSHTKSNYNNLNAKEQVFKSNVKTSAPFICQYMQPIEHSNILVYTILKHLPEIPYVTGPVHISYQSIEISLQHVSIK